MDPSLHYLPGGRVICEICCEIKTHDQLEPVSDDPGTFWDVCRDCAAKEREQGFDNW